MDVDMSGYTMDNPNDLNREHSPSIPSGFPKDKLPEELCQQALLDVVK